MSGDPTGTGADPGHDHPVSDHPVTDPGPDSAGLDGTRAWTVAGSTFLSTFTVFGVAYSFGAFFGPMADEFGSDRGATALFFSLTTFCYFALGVVTGHLADVRGPRPVLLVGAICLVAGLVATARVRSIWLGYLTYGLGVGIGVACAYVPMVATVGGWFERRRTTALGLAVAGIGTGTLVAAPLAERLIAAHGWRATYLIWAGVAAVLLALAAVGAERPPVAPGAGPTSSLADLVRRSRAFWLLYGSILLVSLALFVPFVFLPDYVDTREVGGPAGWLVGLIGVASVAGRLGLGALASRWSAFHLYQGSIAVMGASFLVWLSAGDRYPMLVVFVVVLGVAYGGFIALAPAVAADQFGPRGLGAVLGALYTAAGLGGLVGPPLAGWIIDRQGYASALVAAFVAAVAGAAVLTPIPGLRAADGRRRPG